MLRKVRKYRWELWLFFGVPIAVNLLETAIWAVMPVVGEDRWYHFWLELPNNIAWLSVLAVSYMRVRRLKRPLLSLIWQQSTVSAAIWLAVPLVRTLLIQDADLTLAELGIKHFLWTWAALPIHLAVLVWYVRKASRGGFRYALTFIGVAAFPGVGFVTPAVGNPIAFYTVGLIANAVLSLVVVRVLYQADQGVVNGRTLAALFSAVVLGEATFVVLQLLGWWKISLLSELLETWDGARWVISVAFVQASWALQYVIYVIAVGVGYIVRARHIDPDFVTGEQPPTDEGPKPPMDEGDDFVGLYRRRV